MGTGPRIERLLLALNASLITGGAVLSDRAPVVAIIVLVVAIAAATATLLRQSAP